MNAFRGLKYKKSAIKISTNPTPIFFSLVATFAAYELLEPFPYVHMSICRAYKTIIAKIVKRNMSHLNVYQMKMSLHCVLLVCKLCFIAEYGLCRFGLFHLGFMGYGIYEGSFAWRSIDGSVLWPCDIT